MADDSVLLSEDALPSQTTSRAWIYVCPPNRFQEEANVDESQTIEDKLSTTGKWLLFNDDKVQSAGELTPHDKAWWSIRSLVLNSRNTGLVGAKCSTKWTGKYAGSSSGGVICCYTPDYNDKRTVKKAADAIRAVYNFPRDMFYKTDNATYAMQYTNFGDNAVCIYKHTIDKKFFERDLETKKWISIDI